MPQLLQHIPDLIPPIAIDSEHYILLGNLNFHLHDPSDTNTTDLLESMSNIGLRQLVTDPTRIAGHILNPIFTSSTRVKYNLISQLT